MKVTAYVKSDDDDESEENNKVVFRTMVDLCNLAKMTKFITNVFKSLERKQFNTIRCPFPKVSKKLAQGSGFSTESYRESTNSQMSLYLTFMFHKHFYLLFQREKSKSL